MSKELEIIEQQPVILISVGEINTEGADNLLKVIKQKIFELDLENKEVNEDTVKDIKTIRADLNKELANIKSSVKVVKDKFNEPIKTLDEKAKLIYEEIETASNSLGLEIKKYEDNLKLVKENKLKEYFNDTKALTNERLNSLDENIDFVNFEDVELNITLSASMTSLEKQITDHLEKRYNDMLVVNSHPNSDRLRVKYYQLKHLGNALVAVQKDVAAEEELAKKRPEPKEETKVEPTIIERKETVAQLHNMTFKVYGTLEELRAVKNFLILNGIKYE